MVDPQQSAACFSERLCLTFLRYGGDEIYACSRGILFTKNIVRYREI